MQFDHYAIRPVTTADLIPYFEMVTKNRPRLADFFAGTVSRTATLKDTEQFLIDIAQKARERRYFAYLITDTTSERIIGFIDLKNLDWNLPKSEVGLFIDAEYGGQGISAKAMEVFCTFCFKNFVFEKLFLRTHERNKPAIAIAEKCGFKLEGTLRKDYKTTAGNVVDLLYYGRLRSDRH